MGLWAGATPPPGRIEDPLDSPILLVLPVINKHPQQAGRMAGPSQPPAAPPTPPPSPQGLLKEALSYIARAGEWTAALCRWSLCVVPQSVALRTETAGSALTMTWTPRPNTIHHLCSSGRDGCAMDRLWAAFHVGPQDLGMRRFLWRAIRRHQVRSSSEGRRSMVLLVLALLYGVADCPFLLPFTRPPARLLCCL